MISLGFVCAFKHHHHVFGNLLSSDSRNVLANTTDHGQEVQCSMTYCHECGMERSETADFCSGCGEVLTSNASANVTETSSNHRNVTLHRIVGVLLIWGAFFDFSNGNFADGVLLLVLAAFAFPKVRSWASGRTGITLSGKLRKIVYVIYGLLVLLVLLAMLSELVL